MKILLRFILYFITCLFAQNLAYAGTANDSELRILVVGKWQEVRALENEEDRQIMEIKPDGQFEVRGTARNAQFNRPFVWCGTWKIVGGKFRYKTTYSDYMEAYPVGEEFTDEIVLITKSEWRMLEGSTGNESNAKRIK